MDKDVMKRHADIIRRMTEYHDKHGTGPGDYETYSQDPEWQKLNKELEDVDKELEDLRFKERFPNLSRNASGTTEPDDEPEI